MFCCLALIFLMRHWMRRRDAKLEDERVLTSVTP